MAEAESPEAGTAGGGELFAPELVVGLVTPLGVDVQAVLNDFVRLFKNEVDYHAETIHLTQQLSDARRIETTGSTGLDLVEAKIRLGNALASEIGRASGNGRRDAFALYAINGILNSRLNLVRTTDRSADSVLKSRPATRATYLIRSLKRPSEITTLRRVYGPWVVIVGVFAEREVRINTLLHQLREEGLVRRQRENQIKARIQDLLDRDAREEESEFGQNAREAFADADVFLDVSPNAGPDASRSITRLIRLLFQDRSYTPSEAEHAMFHAHAAALRSSSPFRQVGAAIVDAHGEVISTGTNEVPIANGGQSWDKRHAGEPDRRDIAQVEGQMFGETRRKRDLILDTMRRLAKAGMLEESIRRKIETGDPDLASDLQWTTLKDSELLSLVEFQRPVHAEMAALMNALAHGSTVDGATLYVTAFPCHVCARHILEAGIRKVVYIEPYPKSRTPDFYPQDVSVDRDSKSLDQISFEPFIGIGPNLYSRLFASQDRDRIDGEGHVKQWTGGSNTFPRLGPGDESRLSQQTALGIRTSEMVAVHDLNEAETKITLPVTLSRKPSPTK